jgi:tRNA-2-methylthio-N6-dimethylallyladenosine synthase
MFQYSPRPGTPAAELPNQIDRDLIQERFDRLVALQDGITFDSNRVMVGHRYEVLVEGPSKRDLEIITARTRGAKPVHVPGSWEPGSLFTAEVTRAAPHHLVARAV